MNTRTLASALVVIAGLCACSSSTNAIFKTVQSVLRKNAAVSSAPLNPDFRYLRATVEGRVALLVLGYVDREVGGPVQVWYSAEREVLRLQNGRLVGAVGLTTEWRNVKLEGPPDWSLHKNSTQDAHWIRVRDVMPGYRLGVRDELYLRVISAPRRSAIQNLDPDRLTWYEEHLKPPSDGSNHERLPPARFAIAVEDGSETVVYSEQCLSPKLCFSLQRWPVTSPTAQNAK